MNRPVRIRACVAATARRGGHAVGGDRRRAWRPSTRATSRNGCPTSRPTSWRAGRCTPTGLGLAAAYIENHLRMWGAKPAGDNGARTCRPFASWASSRPATRRSPSRSAAQTRTFADGDGVTFPRNVGGKRRFTVDRVEFAGYGVDVPRANHVDFAGKDVKGAAVVWLGARGPRDVEHLDSPAGCWRAAIDMRPSSSRRRPSSDRSGSAGGSGRRAGGQVGRGAGRWGGRQGRRSAGGAGGGRGGQIPAADFTTDAASRRVRSLRASPARTNSSSCLFSRAPSSTTSSNGRRTRRSRCRRSVSTA